MTTVEILRGAKVELAKRGLHKSHYFAESWDTLNAPPAGPCCVRGACVAAAGSFNGDDGEVLAILWAATPGQMSPEYFNDAPSTTIDDVQALLDRAIALAEGQVNGH